MAIESRKSNSKARRPSVAAASSRPAPPASLAGEPIARTVGPLPYLAPAGERLASLDAFRGLTIAAMIVVNHPGSLNHIHPLLRHADWDGLRPPDLVFPFFLVIVGVSLVFSLARVRADGLSAARVWSKVLRRTVLLFGLGILLNVLAALPYFDPWATRIPGILQRIAVCFLVSALLVRTTGWRAQAGILSCLLVGYWLLMTRVPVPGFGAGALASRQGNLAAFVDHSLLGDHLWKGTWDPEGLLSTLPAIATTLCGVLAGHLLRTKLDRGRKTLALVVAGSAGVGLGLAWQPWFPINKSLWTSSYALVTAGLALGALALCHWLIDVRGFRRWALPFVILGTNAIAAFFLSEVFDRILALVPMPMLGARARPRSVKAWLYTHAFVSWAGPVHGSWLYALAYLLGWMGVLALLYRRGIFIQI